MSNKNGEYIDISDIFHTINRYRVFIAVLTILGLLVGIVLSIFNYVRGEMKSNYTITASIAVTSVTEDGLFSTHSSTPNSTDINLAEDMVDAVIYVIRADNTLQAAIDELHLVGVTVSDIRSNLSLSQYKETQIIEMQLTWKTADEGVMILEAINKVAPQILIDSLKIGGVTEVNPPKSSTQSNSIVNRRLWVLFTCVGMFAGICLCLLKMLIFPSIISKRNIENNLRLEVLGEIPNSRAYFSQRLLPDDAEDDTDAPKADPRVKECFISLAHILRHRLAGNEKPVCLFVTSALPNEGKTCVLANLAVQLAAIECRVLMIDMDVHNPSLGTCFADKVGHYHSLNGLYRGEVKSPDAVVHLTACLDLLPAYLEKDNPIELNEEIFGIIKTVSAGYDYVLMDTSPVGCSADMLNLNKIAQTALFVVRQDVTPVSQATAALSMLHKSGIPVVGAVLNAASKITDVTYYRYHHYSHEEKEKREKK